MAGTLVMIGTRKGVWIATSRRAARSWDLDGPDELLMQRSTPSRSTPRRRPRTPRLFMASKRSHWGPQVLRSDDLGAHLGRAARRRDRASPRTPAPRWSGSGSSRPAAGATRTWSTPAPSRRAVPLAPTAARPSRSSAALWDHPHRQEWGAGFGGQAIHTVLPHPTDPDAVTVAMSTGGVYRTSTAATRWAPANEGIRADFLPEGRSARSSASACTRSPATRATPTGCTCRTTAASTAPTTTAAPGPSIADGLPTDFGFPVVAHPHRPGTVYVFPLEADGERDPAGRPGCRVCRTEDAGETWSELATGLPDGLLRRGDARRACAPTTRDPAGVYFGTRDGEVFASHDEGDSWQPVAEHLPDVLCVRAAALGRVRRDAVRRRAGRNIRPMPDDPTQTGTPDIKPRSRDVTDGLESTAARGMLRAVGMGDDDWAKPQIGVASSWNEITPCNLSLDRLAKAVKDGVHAAGGYPLEFGTISVSDGISMGHEGMHFSLVSREVIADSVETVMMAERLDGSVLLAGCDKSLPGMLMAAARLDLASVFLYAGSIMPGAGRTASDVTIIDAFEAVGACLRGPDHAATRSTRSSAPSARARAPAAACTPPTRWPPSAEALGMSLPGSAAPPAVDRRRDGFAHRSGEAVVELLRQGITARQIMTKEAFENAIAVVMALGGSTNAVLHLLAIAREAEVDLTLDDFNRIGDKVPHLGDLKPFGRYVMNDVDKIGGIPVVMKALLDAGLLHGDVPDRHRQDDGREPRRHRAARRRRQRSSASSASRSTRTGGHHHPARARWPPRARS